MGVVKKGKKAMDLFFNDDPSQEASIFSSTGAYSRSCSAKEMQNEEGEVATRIFMHT